MALLITYVLIALVFSFLCSIAEAVLLSVTAAYVAVLEKRQKPSGALLRQLKSKINEPLAAILTLNTIAHTIGAAGAGAQVTIVFGNAYLGVASAILTLLILFLSEIIPKTLGAHHWRTLAPVTAYCLKFLVEGFVLRGDLLLAQASGRANESLASFMRKIPILPSSLSLAEAFNEVLRVRAHIVLVVDEFGSPVGVLALEDIIETLLGLEIVDEGDEVVDMREKARRLWKRRTRDNWLDFSRLKDRE